MKDTILIWGIPEDFPQSLIAAYDRERSPDRFQYRDGRHVEYSGMPVFIFPGSGRQLGEWDVLPNDARLPLVRRDVADLLLRLAADDCEFLDAAVEHRQGVARGVWKLVNVTRCVYAIDHARSEYTLVPGTNQILCFKKLRFRSGALGETNIARDVEYKSHILVSAVLAESLNANRVRGVALRTEVEVS